MPLSEAEPSFSARAEIHSFDGLLFDMDGTIIDSTHAIIQHWHRLGKKLGVDPNAILENSHGRRSIDILQLYDAKLATWEYVSYMEGQIPQDFGQDAIEVPGSRRLLDQLEEVSAPWMIVTSGTRPLVTGWLRTMKLAEPKNLVVAEDVEKGKPDPSCYILGASRLGLQEGASPLVLEDSPAGVRAGKAAGFKVVALATTHAITQLQEAGADWIVEDMRSVSFHAMDKTAGRVSVMISNALM